MKNVKVGDVVEVKFDDHAWHEDESEPGLAPVIAWGCVEKVTPRYIHLVSWVATDNSTVGKEACTIARGCITQIRRLK